MLQGFPSVNQVEGVDAKQRALIAGSLHGPAGSRVPQHLPAALLESAANAADRATAAALPGCPGDHQPHPVWPHRQEQARGERGASTVRRHIEKWIP